MNRIKINPLLLSLFLCFILSLSGCGAWRSESASSAPPPKLPPAEPLPSDEEGMESAIRFLEDRVKNNPSDFVAYNMLAGRYLTRMRQTGSMNYLELASRAVEASLATAPKEMNIGAVSALAEIEFTSHDFAAARDNAKLLIKIDPTKLGSYQLYADSMLELDDYKEAGKIYQETGKKSYSIPYNVPSIEIRYARIASLYGKL